MELVPHAEIFVLYLYAAVFSLKNLDQWMLYSYFLVSYLERKHTISDNLLSVTVLFAVLFSILVKNK